MHPHPLPHFYSRFICRLVLLSTPSTPQVLFPSKLRRPSMLSTTSPPLHSSTCAIPMIALNGNLHRTLADRRVSSLEGHRAVSPWVRTCNIDPSTAWHSSIAWGAASTIRLLCRMRPYRTGDSPVQVWNRDNPTYSMCVAVCQQRPRVLSLNRKGACQIDRSRCVPTVARGIGYWIQSSPGIDSPIERHSQEIAKKSARALPRRRPARSCPRHDRIARGRDGRMTESPFRREC